MDKIIHRGCDVKPLSANNGGFRFLLGLCPRQDIWCRPWSIYYQGEDGVGSSVVADGFSTFIRDRIESGIESGHLSLASRATGNRRIGSMGDAGYMSCQASDMYTDKLWEESQKPAYVAIGIALWLMVSSKNRTTEY